MRKISYIIDRRDPNFDIYDTMSDNSRKMYNTLLSLNRAYYFHRSKSKRNPSIYTIPDELGIDVRKDVKNPYSATTSQARVKEMKKKGIFDIDSSFGTKLVQQVSRTLERSWKSYFALRKKGISANIPGYVKDRHAVDFNIQMLSKKALREGYIQPMSKSTTHGFKLPYHIPYSRVKSARLIPRIDKKIYELEIIYKEETPEVSVTGNLTAGIDIGINNLYTIAFSDFSEGVIVSGKKLKHLNQKINYHTDKHRSKTSKHGITEATLKEKVWWEKRRRRLYNEYTTLNNRTVEELQRRSVSTVVIGWNEGIKTRSRMGKRNNREFVFLPLRRIADNLKYKLEQVGISVIFVEESYTSKSSFCDGDDLPVYAKGEKVTAVFSGKRKHRGLYITRNGGRINADLNAAFNIIRKHVPEFTSLCDLVERDAVVYPVSRLGLVRDVPRKSYLCV